MNSVQFQGFLQLADTFDYTRLSIEQYVDVLNMKQRCLEIFSAIKSNERAIEDIRSRTYKYLPDQLKIIPEPQQLPQFTMSILSTDPANTLDHLNAAIHLFTLYHAATLNLYKTEASRETQLYRAIRDTNFDPLREQNSIDDKLAQTQLANAMSKLAEEQTVALREEIRKAEIDLQIMEHKQKQRILLKKKRLEKQQMRLASRAEKRCKKIMDRTKRRSWVSSERHRSWSIRSQEHH